MAGKRIRVDRKGDRLMHMANELLSVPVAAGTLGLAGAGLAGVCRKTKHPVTPERTALMGMMGAFIFAAQMVNFQLPGMPGTSGHMIGAVLLAIILGPNAGAIVISTVLIIQCLIFQDGGLLALGCNIINMGIVPCCLGYFSYRAISAGRFSPLKNFIATVTACILAVEAGAILVVLEASLSGVLAVPMHVFMVTMAGVHLLVGLIEGLITVAVLGYLRQVRPDILACPLPGTNRLGPKTVLASLGISAIVIASVICLFASGMPDGLEWSYAQRPDQPGFEPIVANDSPSVAAVDELQERYSVFPDYSKRTGEGGRQAAAGWRSLAGTGGAFLTMAAIWLVAKLTRKKGSKKVSRGQQRAG
jgi:cobalt/nickel transport system permease protein